MLCVTHRGTAAPEPQQRPNNGSTDSPNAPSSVSHTRGLSPLVVRTFPQVISSIRISRSGGAPGTPGACITPPPAPTPRTLTLTLRSEEHTSELQSPCNLVCRLLLEKKK